MNLGASIYFGPFHVDAGSACVWRGNKKLTLSAKAFAILCHLLEHRNRVVTKEELLQTLWPETIVGDAVLKVHVGEIRRVLGDKVQTPQFVETVHRRGYRFVATVTTAALVQSSKFQVQSQKEVVDSQHSVVSRQKGAGDWGLSTSSSPQAPGLKPLAPSLVGREKELQLLHNLLAKAQIGDRQFLLIAGEAGIGKTTLVETFLSQVGASMDVWVIAGQCVEQYGIGEAYRPLLEAIGRLCRDPKYPLLLPLLNRYAPTWLMQIPSLLTADDLLRLQREVLGATSERMLREMAEAVEALTAERTCVLVLEDLHWSDYATLDLLAALARRHEQARLLVIGTYRPVDVIVSGHPLKAVRQELQIHGQCQELALELLSEDEVAEYLSRRFVMTMSDQRAALARMIHRRTDGNPLFIVNVVSDVVRQGFLTERNGRWELRVEIEAVGNTVPENVRHMIDQQVERLSDKERHLLEVGSVVGMEFSSAVVAAALEDDEQEVVRYCEALARRGQFLRSLGLSEWPDGTVMERYQFVHALHQSTLYQRVALGRRVQLYRRIGERLERAYSERPSEIATELAAYFEQGRDYQRAVTYLLRGAETAVRRYANREAVDYLSRALQLVEHLPEPEQEQLRMLALERRGLAYRSMANMKAAADDFATLAEYRLRRKQIELTVGAYLHLATVSSWIDRDRCLAAVQQAVAWSRESTREDFRAHTQGEAAYWNLLWSGWQPEDERAGAQAITVARRMNDLPALGIHVGRYSYFLALQSNYQAADHAAAEGIELTREAGNVHHFLLCYFFRAWSLLHLGHWGEMLRVIREGREIAEKNGHHLWAILLRLELAWLFEHTGDFTRARDLCVQAVQQAEASRFSYGRLLGTILLGQAYLGLNDLPHAIGYFQGITEWLGRERVLMDWILRMPFYYSLGQYYLTHGEFAYARNQAERLCALAIQPGERTYLALGYQLEAAVALAEHHYDQAQTAIDQAYATLEGVEAPLAEWRVSATAMELYQKRNQLDEVQQYRRRSAEVINRLADSLGDEHQLRQNFLTHRPVR